jgi:hypothetical protein
MVMPLRVDHVDAEPVALQPVGDLLNIRCRWAKLGAELIGREPLVGIGRAAIVQLVDQPRKDLLLRWWAPQLEQQMLHREIVGHSAAIVGGIGLGTCIAEQPAQIGLDHRLRNNRLCWTRRRLRVGWKRERKAERQSREHTAKLAMPAKHASPSPAYSWVSIERFYFTTHARQ